MEGAKPELPHALSARHIDVVRIGSAVHDFVADHLPLTDPLAGRPMMSSLLSGGRCRRNSQEQENEELKTVHDDAPLLRPRK